MPAYMIVQIAISDEARMSEYRAAVSPLIAKVGGRIVVRNGKVESLEGRPHDGRTFVMFEFPSLDAIHAFWKSPDYGPVKKLREGAAVLNVWAVERV